MPSNFLSTRGSDILRLLCLMIGLALVPGCQPEPDPFLDLVESQRGTQQGSDLERTMSLAVSDASYDYRQYEEKISGGLNRWIRQVVDEGGEAADDSKQWTAEPLVAALLKSFATVPAVDSFEKLEFVATDPYFIRERSWMKLIADRVCASSRLSNFELMRLQANDFLGDVRGQAPPPVDTSGREIDESRQQLEDQRNQKFTQELMVRLYPDLSAEAAKKLSEATGLFDWVCRNILLEEALNPNDEKIADYELDGDEGLDRPAMGVPGLGYRRFIWQILVYGRGDYLEKSRLFSGLCRQRGIETALLLVEDQPWAVAVLIGGKAWLFDTRLGLPIPGKRAGTIATLDEVRASPELLESLDLTVAETNRDDSRYWIRPDKLAGLRAEIFATPESVSRRMAFLQNRLLGEQRLLLMDVVTETARSLTECIPGIKVGVSPTAFQTHRFRKTVNEALKRAEFDDVLASRLGWYYLEEAYVDQFVDYRSARNIFFIGRFETERNSRKLSAVQGFYSLLYTDGAITNVGVDSARLNRLGIYMETGQSAEQFKDRLKGVQANMRLVRRDVGLFLAQSHFDNGNISSAGNWLEKVEMRDDTTRWTPLVRYLRGRAFESTGNYDKALEFYRSSDGPQFVGDLLRARMLKQAIADNGMSSPPATVEPESTDSNQASPGPSTDADSKAGEASAEGTSGNSASKTEAGTPAAEKPLETPEAGGGN